MMKYLLVAVLFLMSGACVSSDPGGTIVSVRSAHSVVVTTERLEQALTERGMTLFTQIDHSAGAKRVGMDLRPTRVVIFGNPKIGTQLMSCAQMAAIDLPQKALIYEDEQGQVWLAYNDPAYLSRRHGLAGCSAVIDKISQALGAFAEGATR